MKRKPTYEELYKLLEDTLDNLRLTRQLEHLPKDEQSKVIADGYEVFDRWQEIRGLEKL